MDPITLALIGVGLGGSKIATDIYGDVRQQRAQRRFRNVQKRNDEQERHDARRAALMRALKVDAPMFAHKLKDLPEPPDLTSNKILSSLLGFGSNLAAMSAANKPGM